MEIQGSGLTPIALPEIDLNKYLPPGSVILDQPKQPEVIQPEADGLPPGTSVLYDPVDFKAAENVIKSIAADPRGVGNRVRAATQLSEIYGSTIEQAYKNLDKLIEKYTGQRMEPAKATQVIADSWKRANLDIQIMDLEARLLENPYDEGLMNQIEDFESQMPMADNFQYGIITDVLSATANTLPFTMKTTSKGMELAIKAGSVAGLGAGIIGQLGPQVALPEEIITVPAAAFSAGVIAFKAGNTFEAARLSAGGISAEMRKAVDADGNKIPYPVRLAFSLGGGLISGALEQAQFDVMFKGNAPLARIVQKAGAKFLQKTHITGSLVKGALDFMAGMAGNITTEVLQEVSQETVETLADDLARAVSNEIQNSNLEPTTIDEYGRVWKETISQTFKAQLLMAFPGTFNSTVSRAVDEYNTTKETVKVEEEVRTEIEKKIEEVLTPEELDYALENTKNQTPTSFEIKDNRGVAKTDEGIEVGNIEYIPEGEAITITSLSSSTSKTGYQAAIGMVRKIAEENPGKVIWFNEASSDAPAIRKAIEGLNPDISQTILNIDALKFDLGALEKERADLVDLKTKYKTLEAEGKDFTTIEKEDLEAGFGREIPLSLEEVELRLSQIEGDSIRLENRIGDLENLRKNQSIYDIRANWQKTAFEYRSQKVDPKNDPAVENFKIKTELQFPSFKKEEVDAAFELISLRSDAMGMSPKDWIGKYIADIQQMNPKTAQLNAGDAKGAVSFLEDGRAVIHATEASDFTTFVHEMAHIFRRQLS